MSVCWLGVCGRDHLSVAWECTFVLLEAWRVLALMWTRHPKALWEGRKRGKSNFPWPVSIFLLDGSVISQALNSSCTSCHISVSKPFFFSPNSVSIPTLQWSFTLFPALIDSSVKLALSLTYPGGEVELQPLACCFCAHLIFSPTIPFHQDCMRLRPTTLSLHFRRWQKKTAVKAAFTTTYVAKLLLSVSLYQGINPI